MKTAPHHSEDPLVQAIEDKGRRGKVDKCIENTLAEAEITDHNKLIRWLLPLGHAHTRTLRSDDSLSSAQIKLDTALQAAQQEGCKFKRIKLKKPELRDYDPAEAANQFVNRLSREVNGHSVSPQQFTTTCDLPISALQRPSAIIEMIRLRLAANLLVQNPASFPGTISYSRVGKLEISAHFAQQSPRDNYEAGKERYLTRRKLKDDILKATRME